MDVADVQTGARLEKDKVGEECHRLFLEFLENMKDEKNEIKYLSEARKLKGHERNTLKVSFADIQEHNQALATVITQEYYRLYPYLCRALRNFVMDQCDDVNKQGNKQYFVSLTDVPNCMKIRELSTTKVGTLIRISGQVVRTHPVHPELVFGTFKCLDCQNIIKDVEQQFKYQQPSICANNMCQNRARFLLEHSQSTFVDFQKIRIQETQSELPRGAIPRNLEVIVRAESVESAQAGDKCDFIGTLIVVPDVSVLNMPGARAEMESRGKPEGGEGGDGLQGLKALGVRELNYKTAFLACTINQSNQRISGKDWNLEDITPDSMSKQMTPEEWKKIIDMSKDKDVFNNLAKSMFPSIYGHDDVKKGLLLMLCGGVPKKTGEGTALRGDINICIVGDPSTAKSQFLKQVADFSPRAVYTSGKASTAAGLTAAVVRDEESGDFVIEAGALMLADNGVCCIDEFDKMDLKDVVAIHEAMEQQTISITKAGVKATLNARTSILAAANPIGGTYQRGKSLKQNINLSAPIMSRFDLFFILIDEPNEITDYAIANKIIRMHRMIEDEITRKYTQEEVLRFIMFARQFKPVLGKEASISLIKYYKYMRMREGGQSSRNASRITVRQLESLIRLSEAMARLKCLDTITAENVDEAYRLLNASIIRVEQPDVQLSSEDVEVEVDNEALEEMDVDDDDQRPTPTPTPTPSGKDKDKDDDAESVKTQPEKEKEKKISLSFQEYKGLSQLLLLYMKREENRIDNETPDDEEPEYLRKSTIINWYLQEMEHEIATEEDLITKKMTVEKVLERLIIVDHFIIKISTGDGEDEDPYLITHPNYNFEFN